MNKNEVDIFSFIVIFIALSEVIDLPTIVIALVITLGVLKSDNWKAINIKRAIKRIAKNWEKEVFIDQEGNRVGIEGAGFGVRCNYLKTYYGNFDHHIYNRDIYKEGGLHL